MQNNSKEKMIKNINKNMKFIVARRNWVFRCKVSVYAAK